MWSPLCFQKAAALIAAVLKLELSVPSLSSLSSPQAHMQSGIVPSHHPAATHAPMMLMATQGPPGGPQPPMPQAALNPIPVPSTTHFSYLAHAQGKLINLLTGLMFPLQCQQHLPSCRFAQILTNVRCFYHRFLASSQNGGLDGCDEAARMTNETCFFNSWSSSRFLLQICFRNTFCFR